MASAKVLGSFELLENILLFLPLRSLLLSQKVNKACFDVVQGSPDIRRALFWETNSSPLFHYWQPQEDDEVVLEFRHSADEDTKADPPFVNPFMVVRRIDFSPFDFYPEDEAQESLGRDSFALRHDYTNVISGFACASGSEVPGDSRGKMLLTHPPVSAILAWAPKNFDSRMWVAAENNKQGLTLAELHDYGSSCANERSGAEAEKNSAADSEPAEAQPVLRQFSGSRRWMRLKKTIDEITGHEMLWMLGQTTGDLWAELQSGIGGYISESDEDDWGSESSSEYEYTADWGSDYDYDGHARWEARNEAMLEMFDDESD